MDIKKKFILAPLDNVNCASFRLLCKENGADIVSTAMINTKSFIRNPDYFYWYKKERPLLVQFIGNNAEDFKECVKNIKNCDFVDLNAGCPSPDQCKNKSGAALLKDLPRMEKIIKTMVKYSNIPVSVKIRMGWDKDNSIKISKMVEKSGASFLTIHPRTALQSYGIPADWSVIKKVKNELSIPVVASGDLLSAERVKDCFDKTGCDSVMIARGAINDPFIFNDTKHFLKTGELIEHTREERIRLIKRFIKLYEEYDKRQSISELRNHCAWLVKGFRGARKLRDNIGKSKNKKEIMEILLSEV
jgi:tRNA-dihydrouridine synthase B